MVTFRGKGVCMGSVGRGVLPIPILCKRMKIGRRRSRMAAEAMCRAGCKGVKASCRCRFGVPRNGSGCGCMRRLGSIVVGRGLPPCGS